MRLLEEQLRMKRAGYRRDPGLPESGRSCDQISIRVKENLVLSVIEMAYRRRVERPRGPGRSAHRHPRSRARTRNETPQPQRSRADRSSRIANSSNGWQDLSVTSRSSVRHKATTRNVRRGDAVALGYECLDHTALETSGQIIGPNDLKIAAICRANHLRLVTNNLGEFRRVPGLEVEDWTAPI